MSVIIEFYFYLIIECPYGSTTSWMENVSARAVTAKVNFKISTSNYICATVQWKI